MIKIDVDMPASCMDCPCLRSKSDTRGHVAWYQCGATKLIFARTDMCLRVTRPAGCPISECEEEEA